MVIETEKKWKFQEAAELPLPSVDRNEPVWYLKQREQGGMQVIKESLFKSTIGFGEDIAEWFPEIRGARTDVEKLRARGGPWVDLANELEKEIGSRPSTSKIVGDVAGTLLWFAPGAQIKALKGAPVLSAFVNGGLTGFAFGTSQALSESKSIEQSIARGVTGGITGAVLGGVTYGAFKAGGKLFGWAKSKVSEKVKLGKHNPLARVMNRLEALGDEGKEIVKKFKAASQETRLRMGNLADEMGEVGLMEKRSLVPLKKRQPIMSAEMAWKADDSLLDVLTGKAMPNEGNKAAAELSRRALDDVAESASNAGLLPGGKRQNYFPQITPPASKIVLSSSEKIALSKTKTIAEKETIYLQTGVKESLRRDILQNAVFKQKAFRTVSEAGEVLESWAQYVRSGKRAISEGIRPFLNHLVKSGQANNLAEAEAKAFQQFLQKDLPKLPQYGPLERARILNWPFFDPDPRRVLPSYFLDAIARTESVAQFGVGGEVLNDLISKIGKSEGLETLQLADDLVRTATGQVKGSSFKTQVSSILRTTQTPKLSFAAISNLGQSLNTLLGSDLGSLAYGLQSAFTDKGVQRALRSGATLNSVINQQLSYVGGSNFATNLLKHTGFTWTEIFNRTVSANAGIKYAENTFNRLKDSPQNGILMARLEELGISPVVALQRGALVEKELLIAANIFTTKTQFLSEPLYLPAFASSPEGKVLFQFKNYAYNQALFVKDHLFTQMAQKNVAGVVRTLGILGLVFPMTGEVVSDVRSILTGSKRPTRAWDRYWNNIANAGTFGLALDLWESAEFGQLSSAIMGPAFGTVMDLAEGLVQSVEKGEPTKGFKKSMINQFGITRPISNYLYPTRRKNMGDVFDFWDNF